MRNLNTLVRQAATDPDVMEQLIHQHERYILKCASSVAHRFITLQDDEWSIALHAFSQAVDSYLPEKGGFLAFAQLLIQRRLIDYFRTQTCFRAEIAVPFLTFDEPPEEGPEQPALYAAVLQRISGETQNELRWEIDALAQVLSYYGFTFSDLAECSPKAQKTRGSCAKAVSCMLQSPALLDRLRQTKTLPMKIISSHTDVPQKILDRHRRYIIAVVEILTGDYPYLAHYVNNIWEEVGN